MNNYFLCRVGRIPGGINILTALGFREDEGGALVLPLDVNLLALDARRIEIEVGLQNNKSRFHDVKKDQGLGDTEKEPKSTSTAESVERKEGKDGTTNIAPINNRQRFH